MKEKRIAVVTGGNRGIGQEICRQLVKEGLRVVLAARDREKARRGRGWVYCLEQLDDRPVSLFEKSSRGDGVVD